jgi:tyrosyl-tRNA synthetase
MYGKVMSLPDDVIGHYFTLVTRVPAEELEDIGRQLQERSVNPMELKKRLAGDIVTQYHGPEAAERAGQEFERVFQRREPPEAAGVEVPWRELPFAEELPEEAGIDVPWRELPFADLITVGVSPADVLREKGAPVLLATLLSQSLGLSMSEARRLQAQGAIEADGRRITKSIVNVRPGTVIRVGKHRFLRIVDTDKQ